MPTIHWDPTINLGTVLLAAGAVFAFVKGFLVFRDTVNSQVTAVNSLMDAIADHENRLRQIEGVPTRVHRRHGDRMGDVVP